MTAGGPPRDGPAGPARGRPAGGCRRRFRSEGPGMSGLAGRLDPTEWGGGTEIVVHPLRAGGRTRPTGAADSLGDRRVRTAHATARRDVICAVTTTPMTLRRKGRWRTDAAGCADGRHGGTPSHGMSGRALSGTMPVASGAVKVVRALFFLLSLRLDICSTWHTGGTSCCKAAASFEAREGAQSDPIRSALLAAVLITCAGSRDPPGVSVPCRNSRSGG